VLFHKKMVNKISMKMGKERLARVIKWISWHLQQVQGNTPKKPFTLVGDASFVYMETDTSNASGSTKDALNPSIF